MCVLSTNSFPLPTPHMLAGGDIVGLPSELGGGEEARRGLAARRLQCAGWEFETTFSPGSTGGRAQRCPLSLLGSQSAGFCSRTSSSCATPSTSGLPRVLRARLAAAKVYLVEGACVTRSEDLLP